MLQPTHLCNLLVEPGSHPRGQPHLSAASGLVRFGPWLYLVADDEHHLAMLAARGAPDTLAKLLRMLPGDLPDDQRDRKKRKPDFEALVLLPATAAGANGALLAFGSGSKPQRQRAIFVPLDDSGLPQDAHVFDLTALYQPLRAEFADLNIEGAFVAGDRLRLLQRGNKSDARNACIDFSLTQMQAWLEDVRAEAPSPVDVRHYSLGDAGGVPLGFTDGAALPGGGWIFSAAAEDTEDSYNDGACAASAIGWVGEDGTLQRVEHIAGAPKVEGIALAENGRLLMVTDADDPAVPSALLSLDLS